MHDIKIPVDTFSVTEVLACGGLHMLADYLRPTGSPSPMSRFNVNEGEFTLTVEDGTTLESLLTWLKNAPLKVIPEGELPTESVRIGDLRVDWYETRAGSYKTWSGPLDAGLGSILLMLQSEVDPSTVTPLQNVRTCPRVSLRMDTRLCLTNNANDNGGSPNDYSKCERGFRTTQELLAFIGAQRFAPTKTAPTQFSYGVWQRELPLSLATLAFSGVELGVATTTYNFSRTLVGKAVIILTTATEIRST